MELNIKQKAIGSGILFPFKVETKDGKTGVYPVLGDTALIEHNIRTLFLYPTGFRYRQEEYGTNLQSYLEEPNTQALTFLINAHLKAGIGIYEPRVVLRKITTQQYQDWLISRAHYQLGGTTLSAYVDMGFNRNQ